MPWHRNAGRLHGTGFMSRIDPRISMVFGFGLQTAAGLWMPTFDLNVTMEILVINSAIQGLAIGVVWCQRDRETAWLGSRYLTPTFQVWCSETVLLVRKSSVRRAFVLCAPLSVSKEPDRHHPKYIYFQARHHEPRICKFVTTDHRP